MYYFALYYRKKIERVRPVKMKKKTRMKGLFDRLAVRGIRNNEEIPYSKVDRPRVRQKKAWAHVTTYGRMCLRPVLSLNVTGASFFRIDNVESP